MIQLLTTSVAPGQWVGSGLTINESEPAEITPENPVAKDVGTISAAPEMISLTIAHSKEVHEQVARLLRTLRQFQDHVQPRPGPVQELEPIPGDTFGHLEPIPKEKEDGRPRPGPAIQGSERLEHLFKELIKEVEFSTDGRVMLRLERAPRK
ncbi:hypothetical protein ACYOEI_31185 [Singulisphaera rosea]